MATSFTVEVDADGVAVATFAQADRSMNTVNAAACDEVAAVAERVRGDAGIRGLVIRSGQSSGFCAGADLRELQGAIARWRAARSQDALRAGVADAGRYGAAFRTLEACGKPVACVVHGVALRAGLELALATHHRIATGAIPPACGSACPRRWSA